MRKQYYNRQNYQNKKTPFSVKRKSLIAVLTFLFLGGFFYLFLLSPIFEIKEIKISGNKKISVEEINMEINDYINRSFLLFWKSRNILLFNSATVGESLTGKYLFIDNVKITKKYFNKINIEIKERGVFAIWCESVEIIKNKTDDLLPEEEYVEGEIIDKEITVKEVIGEEVVGEDKKKYEVGDCYYIDNRGVAFDEAPNSVGSLIMTIQDASGGEYFLGGVVVDEKTLNRIINIRKSLEAVDIKIIKFFIKDKISRDLEITVSEGWKLYIDIEQDVNEQINVLIRTLKEKIDSRDRMLLEYIDLRIPDRVYYK